MTPSASNTSPNATAFGQTRIFNGDEFSNNLFSDLAPLLTLFGEQVTKQFLTMSLGWADNVLLSMGPLGILTIVVSAIRVGGVRRLKALVGRARESQATAEQELLSSTSASVCELWSGKEIVRQLGQPDMKELIIIKDEDKDIRVLDLEGAVAERWLREEQPWGIHDLHMDAKNLATQAPNLALNIEGATSSRRELWLWAVVGILLQSTALTIPALATYYWKLAKASAPVQSYAYPCFVAGTCAIILGTMLCSHVIEAITEERTFQPPIGKVGRIVQVLRLQKACKVSDQSFPPFLIYNKAGNHTIRTSRLRYTRRPLLSKLAGFASVLTVAGFICQFVGLRGLHWSATILQLGVTLIMTAVRSWVRRGLAANPPCIELKPKYELMWAAIILSLDIRPEDYNNIMSLTYSRVPNQLWEVSTGGFKRPGQDERRLETDADRRSPRPSLSTVWDQFSPISWPPKVNEREPSPGHQPNNLLEILTELQVKMPDQNLVLDIATKLCRAIEQTLSLLERHLIDRTLNVKTQRRGFAWQHWVSQASYSTSRPTFFPIKLSCARGDGVNYEVPRERIYAIIQLCLRSWDNKVEDQKISGSIPFVYRSQTYIRVIGRCADIPRSILELLPRWIGKKILLCPTPDGSKEFESEITSALRVPLWPLFGLSTMSGEEEDPPFSEESPIRDPTSTLQSEIGFIHSDLLRSEQNITELYAAIISHHPIAIQCALELFYGLIDAVAKDVEDIGGTTKDDWATTQPRVEEQSGNDNTSSSSCSASVLSAKPDSRREEDFISPISEEPIPSTSGPELVSVVRANEYSSSYDGRRWTNSVLLSISQTLVDAGIVGNLEEANAVVIPPFARRELLPKKLGQIRNATKEPSRPDLQQGDPAI